MPGIIGIENRASKQSKIQRRKVKISLEPRKVKHFSFTMFHDKTEPGEKSRNNIVATKKIHIWHRNGFVLRNEKSIINKRQNRNRNF